MGWIPWWIPHHVGLWDSHHGIPHAQLGVGWNPSGLILSMRALCIEVHRPIWLDAIPIAGCFISWISWSILSSYGTMTGSTQQVTERPPLCNKSLYGQSHSGLRLQCDFKLAKSFKKKIAPKDCKYIPGVKLYPKSNDKSIQQKELKKSYCQVLKSWSLTLPTYWCFSRREWGNEP